MVGLGLAVATLVVAFVAVWMLTQDRGGARAGEGQTPLDPAKREVVEKRVLKAFLGDHKAVGAPPRVVVARDLTLDDLLSMGLCPSPHANSDEPNFVLAVVSGNLDLTNWRRM